MPPRLPRGIFWAALLLLLVAAGGALLWLTGGPLRSRPVRVLLVVPEPAPEAGVSHYQARALSLLFQDGLEARPETAVTLATAMPQRPEGILRREPWLLVRILPRRQQDRLGLSLEWAWSSSLSRGSRAWDRAEFAGSSPKEVFRQALAALPVHQGAAQVDALLPGSAGCFWELVQADTLRLQNDGREQAIALARSVTQREPEGAEGWFILGRLLYRGLLDVPEASTPDRLDEAEACFRMGLGLVPDHPKGVFQLTQLETNEGEHREALEDLLEALQRRPRNPLLLAGLVYSARNAGLLELAQEASLRRDRWSFPEVQPLGIEFLALYRGDQARFEATLQDQPGHLRSVVQRFFKGYLALMRQDRRAAIEAFASAEAVPRGYPQYVRLARGFRLGAQGEPKEAGAALRALELDRVGLRVPDGEFTLRLAEGFVLAGEKDHAMELAERAFAQGFGAAAWYEASPFLGPLRQSPRWKSLLQHVRERQELLKARFPVGRLPRD